MVCIQLFSINFFGIMGLMLSFIAAVPFVAYLLPALIWILFLKLFFRELSWLYIIVIGVVFFALTLFAIPYLTSFIVSFSVSICFGRDAGFFGGK